MALTRKQKQALAEHVYALYEARWKPDASDATHTVATSTGQDLIRLKTQSVDDYVNRMSGIDYKTIHLTVNKEAYEDGMKSGRNVNLNQTGITNPTMQISR